MTNQWLNPDAAILLPEELQLGETLENSVDKKYPIAIVGYFFKSMGKFFMHAENLSLLQSTVNSAFNVPLMPSIL